MINFVVALSAEASPVVQHWRLRKSNRSHPFSLYSNESVRLAVSGIGKCNSAAATAWLAGLMSAERQRNTVWINLGIAGHSTLPLGTAICANRIVDEATGQTWYPTLIKNSMHKTSVITADKTAEDYPVDFAVEMEASGFYATATKISTTELSQCFKVISDNQHHPASKITPQSAQTMIGDNLTQIGKQIDVIKELSMECELIDSTELETIFHTSWAFSTTQKNQLKRLLHRVLASTGSFESAQQLHTQLSAMPTDSAEVLQQLHAISSSLNNNHN